jgi:hypothetical protein
MQFKVWKIKVYGSDLVPGDITKLGNIIHISKHLGSVSALVTLNGESKTASYTPDRQYDIHRVLPAALYADIDGATDTKVR